MSGDADLGRALSTDPEDAQENVFASSASSSSAYPKADVSFTPRQAAELLYQKQLILLDHTRNGGSSRSSSSSSGSGSGSGRKHHVPTLPDCGETGRDHANMLDRRPSAACNTAMWLFMSILGTLLIGVATLAVTTDSFGSTTNIFKSTASSTTKTNATTTTASVAVLSISSSSRVSYNEELSNIQALLGDDDAADAMSSYVEELKNRTTDDDMAAFLGNFSSSFVITTSKKDDDDDKAKYKKHDKPNIIFILADDLGYNSIGDEDLDMDFATPHLSALAQDGVIMGSYYTQESCTPARAALLTGRYPLSIGMQLASISAYQTRALPAEETLFPEALQDAGYTNYMIGKWNLGHFHPKFLPTSRGFDYSLAFMDGKSYYWSKKSTKLPQFTDLLYADKNHYGGYDGTDAHDYSTFLYRDKAIKAIQEHDYSDSPMFMYLSFQAVHDPFYDYSNFFKGVPKHYISTKLYNKILTNVKGRKRRQYAMALSLLDDAVNSVVDALDEEGELNHSYIIFTSDNGGCYSAGGRNGDLRGTKGSLWEGGTKVDAFVYSPLIDKEYRGRKYDGLFHVTDWFSTVLDMAGVSYTTKSGYDLDGFSQWSYILSSTTGDSSPRDTMLYNYIVNVEGSDHDFDILSNAPVAVRNKEGFKLIHAYVGNPSSEYYSFDELVEDDEVWFTSFECTQSESMDSSGNYTYMLFDLNNDPYETTNLYREAGYALIKNTLYSKIAGYYANSQSCISDSAVKVSKAQRLVWKDAGDYIVPWVDVSDEELEEEGYPVLFSEGDKVKGPFVPSYDEHQSPASGDDEAYTRSPTYEPTANPSDPPTDAPTHKPTRAPSAKPTHHPSDSPTHKPTRKPTFHPTVTGYTHKPTRSPDYVKPTNHPTVTGYTHRPTHSPDYIRPTNHPTVTGYTHRPTHEPSMRPSTAEPSTFVSQAPTQSEPEPEPKPEPEPTLQPTVRATMAPTVGTLMGPDTVTHAPTPSAGGPREDDERTFSPTP